MRGFVNSLSDEARRNNFRKIWLFYLCIFLIVSLVAYIVSYWYPSSKRVAELFLAAGIAICAPGCLDMFFDYLSSLFKISIPKILSEIFILLVLLVSVTVKAVSTEIDKVNRRVFSKSYELTFKNGDAKVVTDSNVVFLGRTRNYIFIHELNSKSSRVINADDVKEVVIKSVQ
ncbi:MAG: hypothetical protein JNN00_17720 [Chitinophagaceae bacterium]|nr:hypothetical protein [Chitinophagaceae bacterium]